MKRIYKQATKVNKIVLKKRTKNGIKFTQSNCKASMASCKIKYNGQPNTMRETECYLKETGRATEQARCYIGLLF